MDVTPLHQQPTTNDEELARVLASAHDETTTGQSAAPAATMPSLDFEETPDTHTTDVATVPDAAPVENSTPIPVPDVAATSIAADTASLATSLPVVAPSAGPLDDLKKTALEELRPLIGKLNLPAEEKFDTLLLIIRSTDDQGLLEPAHEAAKQIPDDAKRAQALLDVIKEIDYFSQHDQTQPIV